MISCCHKKSIRWHNSVSSAVYRSLSCQLNLNCINSFMTRWLVSLWLHSNDTPAAFSYIQNCSYIRISDIIRRLIVLSRSNQRMCPRTMSRRSTPCCHSPPCCQYKMTTSAEESIRRGLITSRLADNCASKVVRKYSCHMGISET